MSTNTPMPNVTNNINSYHSIARELIQAGLSKTTNSTALALILGYGHSLGLKPLETVNCIQIIDSKVVITPEVVLGTAYRKNLIQNFKLEVVDNQILKVVLYRTNRQTQTIEVSLAKPVNSSITDLQQLPQAEFSAVIRLLFPDLLQGLIMPYELKQQSLFYKVSKLSRAFLQTSVVVLQSTKTLLNKAFTALKDNFNAFIAWFSNLDTKDTLELEPELPEEGR